MAEIADLAKFRAERASAPAPTRKMWVSPNDNYPGEWMVGIFYDDVTYVGIASFKSRLEAIDFAVWEAKQLGGMKTYALNYPGFEDERPEPAA